jgi:drug/metabolite transporter (DMT)-like permease
LILAGLNTAQVYMVYFAVQKTYVAHTLLLCSIAPTFLATWRIAKNAPFTRLELLGIGLNVFGAYWCCCDAGPFDKSKLLIGDFVALFSSFLSAAYILLSAPVANEKNCPNSIYLCFMSFAIILFSLFFAASSGEEIVIFSTDPVHGFFGFFTGWDNFLYGFIGLGLLAGLCYHYFTLKAKECIGDLFVNVSFNFAPFLSQVVSFLIGAQNTFPGTFTAFGGFTLFVGCTLLSMNYKDQEELVKAPLIVEHHEELMEIKADDPMKAGD